MGPGWRPSRLGQGEGVLRHMRFRMKWKEFNVYFEIKYRTKPQSNCFENVNRESIKPRFIQTKDRTHVLYVSTRFKLKKTSVSTTNDILFVDTECTNCGNFRTVRNTLKSMREHTRCHAACLFCGKDAWCGSNSQKHSSHDHWFASVFR